MVAVADKARDPHTADSTGAEGADGAADAADASVSALWQYTIHCYRRAAAAALLLLLPLLCVHGPAPAPTHVHGPLPPGPPPLRAHLRAAASNSRMCVSAGRDQPKRTIEARPRRLLLLFYLRGSGARATLIETRERRPRRSSVPGRSPCLTRILRRPSENRNCSSLPMTAGAAFLACGSGWLLLVCLGRISCWICLLLGQEEAGGGWRVGDEGWRMEDGTECEQD